MSMRRRTALFALLVLALGLLAGCQQSSTDPDQVVRDMMTAHTWVTDDTQTNTVSMILTLNAGGTGLMDQLAVTWSYAAGVFKLTRTSDGDSWSTSNPTITDTKFVITWENGNCYLIASGSS